MIFDGADRGGGLTLPSDDAEAHRPDRTAPAFASAPSALSAAAGTCPIRSPADQVGATVILAYVPSRQGWRLEDAADGIFGSSVHPDDPVSNPAFAIGMPRGSAAMESRCAFDRHVDAATERLEGRLELIQSRGVVETKQAVN
jgi:hypothetical protein